MRNHCVCEVALEDQRDALCALFAAGSEPRWKGDEFTVDVRKCAKCRNPIKVTKRVTANGMNQTKAAAEAALWSAVYDATTHADRCCKAFALRQLWGRTRYPRLPEP